MQSRRAKIILATVIVAFVFGFILTVSRSERSRDLVLSIEPIDPSNEVTVYVGGAVEDPGLFSLPRGARVAEAIELAGPNDSSDTSGLQLARVLRDEQSIIVPERRSNPDHTGSTGSNSVSTNPERLLNINQATLDELQDLPGIGPALAERIRERRDLEGPFQSLDELSEVSGISDRMVDELRDYATIER